MSAKVYRGNFQELNKLCAIKDARIAELEAQVAEIHASGLRLEFTHEWYVSGVRRDPGNYVLMRIGPAKDAETPF